MRGVIKFISIVLCITIFCITAVNVYAYTGIKTVTDEVELLQEGNYVLPEKSRDYQRSGLFSVMSNDTVQDKIYEGLLNCEANINIFDYRVPVSVFAALYTNIINSHPDLFYVASSITYSYTANNYVYSVSPMYSLSAPEIESAMEIFVNGVEKALSVVDSSMNDLQKALVLHDYICDVATYPDLSVDDLNIYHSAYGFFYVGKIVCAGYALAYSYLLGLCGIQSEYVVSSSMGHAWNAVKINNKWYNVDLTYDDIGVYNNRANTRGAMMHRCFMISDELLMGDRGYYHYGGVTYDNLDTTNTTYDDYFWKDLDTNILVINGNYYYYSSNYIYKATADNVVTKLGTSSFSSVSSTLSGTYYDENGLGHTVTHKDSYSRLVYLDNRFYITSSKAICSYCPMTDTYRKYTVLGAASDYIVGLGVDDNNQLVYQTRSSGSEIPLDKDAYWRNNLTKSNNNGYNNYVDINLDGYVNGKDYLYMHK